MAYQEASAQNRYPSHMEGIYGKMIVSFVAAEQEEAELEQSARKAATKLTKFALRATLSLREMIDLGERPSPIAISMYGCHYIFLIQYTCILQYVHAQGHSFAVSKKYYTLPLKVQLSSAGETGRKGKMLK